MHTILYGIPNCDQVKKARAWMQAQAQPYVFHDFKKDGVTASQIQGWLTVLPWEMLLNRKGTTWRGLSDARKLAVTNETAAIALMLEAPAVIKRPVLQQNPNPAGAALQCQVGFSETAYRRAFGLDMP